MAKRKNEASHTTCLLEKWPTQLTRPSHLNLDNSLSHFSHVLLQSSKLREALSRQHNTALTRAQHHDRNISTTILCAEAYCFTTATHLFRLRWQQNRWPPACGVVPLVSGEPLMGMPDLSSSWGRVGVYVTARKWCWCALFTLWPSPEQYVLALIRRHAAQTHHRVAVVLRYEVVCLPYFSCAKQKFSFGLASFLKESASIRKLVW